MTRLKGQGYNSFDLIIFCPFVHCVVGSVTFCLVTLIFGQQCYVLSDDYDIVVPSIMFYMKVITVCSAVICCVTAVISLTAALYHVGDLLRLGAQC